MVVWSGEEEARFLWVYALDGLPVRLNNPSRHEKGSKAM
jgi:hypothetical protein